jgi:hypothetical protein
MERKRRRAQLTGIESSTVTGSTRCTLREIPLWHPPTLMTTTVCFR